MRRKLTEQFMSLIVEQRLTKDEILELYLNEVYLGQRGSFAVHGVAEARAAVLRQGRRQPLAHRSGHARRHDPVAAALFAVPRRPSVAPSAATSSCARCATSATSRTKPRTAPRTSRSCRWRARSKPKRRTSSTSSSRTSRPDRSTSIAATADVHTTLDLHLQRLAQDALRGGLKQVDELLARRRRKVGPGAGGAHRDRSAHRRHPRAWSAAAPTTSRSTTAPPVSRRQPGSVFKPFVYLAAFEQAHADGRTDLTPATVVTDEPTTFIFEDKDYQPDNYDDEYDGPITLRRALANSRNVATVKVAETTGYDHVAALWKRLGIGTPPLPYPSIALGVFEATPFEIATAYTIFPNQGEMKPLRAVLTRLDSTAARSSRRRSAEPRRVAERGDDVPRHQHDAQRRQRRHRRERARGRLPASTPRASRARPTSCATPGSSGSRRSC